MLRIAIVCFPCGHGVGLMFFCRWRGQERHLRTKRGRGTRKIGFPRRRSFRPRVESLEDRSLLSGNFGFGLGFGYTSEDLAQAVAVDDAGNVWMAGTFNGTIDFDPGPGTTNLTSDSDHRSFLTKYSSSGELQWAGLLAGNVDDVAVGSDGSVFTTGYFNGTGDFDPGTSVYELTRANYALFVTKLDTDGNFVWASITETGEAFGQALGYSIVMGADSSANVSGGFAGTVDFDPGPGEFLLTSQSNTDSVVLKLDESGNFVWARGFGGSYSDVGRDVAVTSDGGVVTVGHFRYTVDFDPSPDTSFELTSAGNFDDVFISKLDSSGNFAWARRVGDTGMDQAFGVAATADGGIVTVGQFGSTVDFDPGSGVSELTSAGDADIFVLKLDAGGSYVWAGQMGGVEDSESGSDVAVDSGGSIYVAGYFRKIADFDPGEGAYLLSNAGYQNAFVCKLDGAGNFAWAAAMGGASTGSAQGHAVDVASDGKVYVTGEFSIWADVDPGPDKFELESAGGRDIFLVQLRQSQFGDLVWNDLNANGVQDPGEPGIAGAAVQLYSSGDDVVGGGDDTWLATVTTNSSGRYRMDGLSMGTNYYLVFRPPVGDTSYAFTTRNAGSDDAIDSDARANGVTSLFTLPASGFDTSHDAGLVGSAPAFGFAAGLGGAADASGQGMAVDEVGNVYLAGRFSGQVDFDPGPAGVRLTSAGGSDAFVTKYSPAGAILWARRLGGTDEDEAYDLAVAADGSVCVTGRFQGTADFDPGPGTLYLTSTGLFDVFVCRLDADGNLAWAHGMGGTGNDLGSGIALGADGSTHVTGSFQDAVDFDSGSGMMLLDAGVATDAFVLKLNSTGQFVWAGQLAGSADDGGRAIAVTDAGDVCVTGNFQLTADFDPGPGTWELTSAGQTDIFVAMLDSAGDLAWAVAMGGANTDEPCDLAVGDSNSIHVTGHFSGTADFDPGPHVYQLTGSPSAFITKLDFAGNLIWARLAGGDIGRGVAMGVDDNVYTTGSYQGTVDFDPGPGTFSLTSAGGSDAFVSRLDASGTFVWAKGISGSGQDESFGIAIDNNSHVYAAGAFEAEADFDPGPETFVLSAVGGTDAWFASFAQASVEGKVWIDTDSNGLQGLNEPAMEGAVAEAFSSTDDIVGNADDVLRGTVTTDENGFYRVTGLSSQTNHYLVFRPPAGTPTFTFTTKDAGDDTLDTLDSDANANGTSDLFTATPLTDTRLDAGLVGTLPAFGFAAGWGSGQFDQGREVVVDSEGNVYVVGFFEGTADFDPGPGTYQFTGQGSIDIFVAKYTAAGALLWAHALGGSAADAAMAAAVGPDGSLYVGGTFRGSIDFDPGPGVVQLTSAGDADGFVCRFDSRGHLLWAGRQGGGGTDSCDALAVDDAGYVCTAGVFEGTADFDPGGDAFSMASQGRQDAFISRLDANGNFLWAVNPSGAYDDHAWGLAIDAEGYIYTTGVRNSTTAFVSKQSSDGSFVWLKTMGGSSRGLRIAASPDGDIYTVGAYGSEWADFDPGVGVYSFGTVGYENAFVLRLDSDGDFVWARQLGGNSYTTGNGITLGPDGHVYLTGSFRGTADLDPGGAVYDVTSAGVEDTFLVKLDEHGSLVWARTAGAQGADVGQGVAVGADDAVYTTGGFQNSVDFDPGGAGAVLGSTSNSVDAFLWRLDQFHTGDRVWSDLNADGVQDPWEPGMDGVLVELYTSTDSTLGDADDVRRMYTLTDSDGHYRLGGLINHEWAYYLRFVPPLADPAFTFTAQNAGGDDSLDSDADVNGRTSLFSMTPGQVRLDLDAGLVGQTERFGMAAGLPGPDPIYSEQAHAVAVSPSGFIYITGHYAGTVDFDPGPDTYNLTSTGTGHGTFVAKYSPGGAMVWAGSIGSTSKVDGFGIAVAADEGVCVAGNYWDTADFDPGPGNYSLTSAADGDPFVLKLDRDGNFLWVRGFDGTGDDRAAAIAIGPEQGVYFTGEFGGWQATIDFDPRPGTWYETKITAAGSYDAFVCRLGANGHLVWPAVFTGTLVSGGSGSDVAVAPDGSVYTVGDFSKLVDFDPGPATYHLEGPSAPAEGFLSKLDKFGNFVWAKDLEFSPPDARWTPGVAVGPDGSTFTAGNSSVTKRDADGNIVWTQAVSSGNAGDIAVASDGSLRVGGYYPRLLKLASDGTPVWERPMGGNSAAIALGPDDSAYLAGRFELTRDFDPSSDTYELTSIAGSDSFAARIYSSLLPSADAGGPYSVMTPGTDLHLDAAGSVHPDASLGESIVSYDWDLDGDGQFDDASGVNAVVPWADLAVLYPTGDTYDIALRVTDSGGAADVASTLVQINRAPVAVAREPYFMNAGEDVPLDGSGSSDPDADYGDSIVAYRWDLDDDGQFDDANGAQPMVVWADIEALGLDYPADPVTGQPTNTVRLEVEDAFGAKHVASTTLTIYDQPPDNIGAYRTFQAASGLWVSLFVTDSDGDGQWTAADKRYVFRKGTQAFIENLQPIVGDFNGDGHDQIGVYRTFQAASGLWVSLFVIDSDGDGQWTSADTRYIFRQGTQTLIENLRPIVGDFNGDGHDQIGVYRTFQAASGLWVSLFVIDSDGDGKWTSADTRYIFRQGPQALIENLQPIVGDFDGDGQDNLGVYRTVQAASGQWVSLFVTDSNGDGKWTSADARYVFRVGPQAFIENLQPIVGDFSGDGQDDLGVYRTFQGASGQWVGLFVTDSDADGRWTSADARYVFRTGSQEFIENLQPIIGVWDGYSGGLLTAATATTKSNPPASTLTRNDLTGVYQHAVDVWSATLALGPSQKRALQHVDVQISDLPGAQLGKALGTTITLDLNAADWGWFVDATPWDNTEFMAEKGSASLTAGNNSVAGGRIDLLTAVLHELGHVLGKCHSEDGVMQETLGLDTRRLPGGGNGFAPAMIDRVFAD